MNRETCKGCIYHRRMGDDLTRYCHYLLDTGEKRGCPAENCTRHTKVAAKDKNNDEEENEMPKGTATPVETVHKISELRAEGKTLREISKITGVPQTTVTRVCAKLNAGTKNEPAPSANGTSSKEVFTASIVADNSGDVKPREEIPEIVLDALTDTLDDLYAHEREFRADLENLKKRIEINNWLLNDTLKNISELRVYICGLGYGSTLTALDAARGRGEEDENL